MCIVHGIIFIRVCVVECPADLHEVRHVSAHCLEFWLLHLILMNQPISEGLLTG